MSYPEKKEDGSMIRKTQPDARMVMTKAAGERSTHAARDIAVLHSGANKGMWMERRRWNE